MSKERIIYKGDPCPVRVKGNRCGYYSLLLVPRDNSKIPTGVVETRKGGKQCGMMQPYSQMEKCVIPGDGRGEVEIKSFKD